jgi:hypothetical protein
MQKGADSLPAVQDSAVTIEQSFALATSSARLASSASAVLKAICEIASR